MSLQYLKTLNLSIIEQETRSTETIATETLYEDLLLFADGMKAYHSLGLVCVSHRDFLGILQHQQTSDGGSLITVAGGLWEHRARLLTITDNSLVPGVSTQLLGGPRHWPRLSCLSVICGRVAKICQRI